MNSLKANTPFGEAVLPDDWDALVADRLVSEPFARALASDQRRIVYGRSAFLRHLAERAVTAQPPRPDVLAAVYTAAAMRADQEADGTLPAGLSLSGEYGEVLNYVSDLLTAQGRAEVAAVDNQATVV